VSVLMTSPFLCSYLLLAYLCSHTVYVNPSILGFGAPLGLTGPAVRSYIGCLQVHIQIATTTMPLIVIAHQIRQLMWEAIREQIVFVLVYLVCSPVCCNLILLTLPRGSLSTLPT
jgi:hypothetical protein